jgi:hypothetical protein
MTGSFTSGLGSQLGLAAETTYGTAVTVAKFFEYTSETLKLDRQYVLSKQLRAGRMMQSSSRRSATTKSAAGGVVLEVPTAGFGPILNLLHGETVTPSKESTFTVYKQVHPIGTSDPYKKSITLQIGRPTDEGVVNPFTFPGVVATSVALSCQTAGMLTATLALDAQDEVTATSLATASYPTALESFNFTQMKVMVNGVEQKQVRGTTMTFPIPRDTSRYYAGQEHKAVPLLNDYVAPTVALDVDYSDNTLYKLFSENHIVPIEVVFEGAIIESTFHKTLKFVMPACGFEGDSPNVPGPAVLTQSITIPVLDNGTETPITATYISVDSAL